MLKALPDRYRHIAVFGHNPMFDALAAFLLPDFSQELPKGAAVGCSCEIAHWQELRKYGGKLAFFISPEAHDTKSKHHATHKSISTLQQSRY